MSRPLRPHDRRRDYRSPIPWRNRTPPGRSPRRDQIPPPPRGNHRPPPQNVHTHHS
ncbi:hypothetical protein A2U01_0100445, partial [Trifolium medium]|nr:hypothetical protein [Trifolium medium]